ELTAGAHLDEQVAQGGRLDWSGHDWPLAGVGGELIKQGVPRAAADYVNDFHAVAGELLQPAKHLAIPEREALVGATHQLAFGFRHRLFGFAAEVLDRLGHVGRVEEARDTDDVYAGGAGDWD